MGNFRKGDENRFGGQGGGFNRRNNDRGSRFGGDRDRVPVTMHQAICDQCGKSCEVPFRPTSGKPVYCNTCFGGKKEIGNNRDGNRFSQRNYDSRETSFKPDFGSDTNKGSNNEVKRQLEILNGKMDLLIKAVESIADIKSPVSKNKFEKEAKAVSVIKIKKS